MADLVRFVIILALSHIAVMLFCSFVELELLLFRVDDMTREARIAIAVTDVVIAFFIFTSKHSK